MVSKWFYKDYREFTAYGEYGEGPPSDVSLIGLLNLNHEDLKPFTKDLLNLSQQPQKLQTSLSELSRGINALFQFQDILDVSLDMETSDLVNRHYAYYEGLAYLRESAVSWLDQNVLAGLTLLRPFLELSVFHVYWYVRCKHKSYKPYYDWLKHGKGKPGFQNALDYIFNNLPTKGWASEKRLQELKLTIQNAYKALCAYNHTPQMNESITAKSGGFGNLALESFLYYLELTNILLHQVVYLFILAYPMSLFPVEKHIKWAFSGPVGLFFDKVNYAIIETYISPDNAAIMKQSLAPVPEVKSLLEWFDSFPTLTAEEINTDWEQLTKEIPNLTRENTSHLFVRLALMKSHNRSLGWALNYVIDQKQDSEIPDEVVEKLRKRIRTWGGQVEGPQGNEED